MKKDESFGNEGRGLFYGADENVTGTKSESNGTHMVQVPIELFREMTIICMDHWNQPGNEVIPSRPCNDPACQQAGCRILRTAIGILKEHGVSI